jgi:hypothetical protein
MLISCILWSFVDVSMIARARAPRVAMSVVRDHVSVSVRRWKKRGFRIGTFLQDPVHANVILRVALAVALPSESEHVTCPISIRLSSGWGQDGGMWLEIAKYGEIKVAAAHTHAMIWTVRFVPAVHGAVHSIKTIDVLHCVNLHFLGLRTSLCFSMMSSSLTEGPLSRRLYWLTSHSQSVDLLCLQPL